MDGKRRIAWLTLGICLSLFAWSVRSASGGPALQCEYCEEGTCVPHVRQFGYYPRGWRTWPDEPRPDRTFPQSISAEVLPTPTGTEKLSLPKASGVPEAPRESSLPGGGQRLPTESPLEMLGEPPLGQPAEKGILPPGKKIQIDEQPEMPTEPKRPLLDEVPAEKGLPLPGLPTESDPSLMPGLPLDPSAPLVPKEDGALPGLPLDPSAPLMPKEDGALPGLPPDGSSRTAPSGVRREPADWADAVRPDRNNDLRHEVWVTDALDAAVGSPLSSSQPVQPAAYQAPAAPLAQPRGVRSAGLAEDEHASEAAEAAPVPTTRPERADALPLGLDGFCPVRLVESESWARGDPQLTEVHRGRVYRFSGTAERERFLLNPDRYAPALSGFDATLIVDANRYVPGQTAFCAVYAGRVYMFSSAASLASFRSDARRYAAATSKRRD